MTQPRHERGEETAGLAFSTRNDLPADAREPIVGLLNGSLADTTDLLTQAKFAHWNVKGPNFYQLHLLFDELAETLLEHQDRIAERATALGGQALGTVRMAARNSAVPEIPTDAVTGREYLDALAENLAVHAANLREAIESAEGYGDEDTMDLYTEISRDVDKHLWFLEAHLQTEPFGSGASAGERSSFPAATEPEATEGRESVGERRRQPARYRPNGRRRYGRSPPRSEGFDRRPSNR